MDERLSMIGGILDRMDPLSDYLKPTGLCDFDRAPEIGETAHRLAGGLADARNKLDIIATFVKGLPYGLEDWDIPASQTLGKGWGMCSGKSNLLVAMLRSLQIPARYRITRIKSEGTLWQWIASHDTELAALLGPPLPSQDHVTAEIHLGHWEARDVSRDSALEGGFRRLGIPLERKALESRTDGTTSLTLAFFDAWAFNRQEARHFREDRGLVFSRVNQCLDVIRSLGRDCSNSIH